MERQDIMYFAGAVIIVAVLALIVRPAMTGEGIPFLQFGEENNTEAQSRQPDYSSPAVSPGTGITTTIPTPTPTAPWDGTVKTVGFVDPSTYNVDMNVSIPAGTVQKPQSQNRSTLVTYAVMTGEWSGTSEIVHIPFPYWELHYTVEPSVDISREDVMVFPRISIQVMDADDPNRFVRIINPGQLDTRTWSISDPRPWKEKFYEGNRNYYFILNARFIASYELDIMVPEYYT